jgi:hypothetical protein
MRVIQGDCTRVGIYERIEAFAALTKEIEPVSFKGDLIALTTLHLTPKEQQEFIQALDGDIYRRLPKARMALMLRLEALVSDGSKRQASTICPLSMYCRRRRQSAPSGRSRFPMKGTRIMDPPIGQSCTASHP